MTKTPLFALALGLTAVLMAADASAFEGRGRGFHDRSLFDADDVFAGYGFPYQRYGRRFGPGVVVNPFFYPDGGVGFTYLRDGYAIGVDYIGVFDYGRNGGRVGFFSDRGYYHDDGRFCQYGSHGHDRPEFRYRAPGFAAPFWPGAGQYSDRHDHYDRDGRYRGRYDDRDRYDRDRNRDRYDRRDNRYPRHHSEGGVPPGGLQSKEFPGGVYDGFSADDFDAEGFRPDDLDNLLDG
ncbi:MAG: hypothetical protein AAF788_04200 [Pseudomonadota bacterium]